VVELHDVGHRFGPAEPWLFRHVEVRLDPRERLGVVGPNGAGKTTLLQIMAGRIDPAEGRVVHGSTVALALWDQRGIEVDPATTVRDAFTGPHRDADWSDLALLERFWFDGDAQRAPVGTLSGGERRRLQLLLTLGRRPNVLLLDEPTNDLDIDTLRALEDFLDDWPGALVAVSHDRAFLERTVADVIVIDESHDAVRVPGGYEAWRSNQGRIAPPPDEGRSTAPRAPRRGPAATDDAGRRSPSTLRFLTKKADAALREVERARDRLRDELAQVDPADHRRMAEVATALASAEDEVSAAEETWLELAAEAEG
jgi:ATP-binding cassette subfamily F protein uup